MKKALRWIITIVVIAGLVGGGYYAYAHYYAPTQGAINISTLQVVKLSTGSVAQTVSTTGTVRTKQTAQVAWQASGKLGKINVKVGDKVKANDILASLDPAFLPNNILQAQQSLVDDQQALDDLSNNQTNLPQAEKAVLDAQTAETTAQNTRNQFNNARGTAGQIANAQAVYLQSKDRADQMQAAYDALPGNPNVDNPKAVALTRLVNAKANLATALEKMQWIQGKPSASDIATADNTLALVQAKLADAQHALELAKNGANSADVTAAKQKIAADQALIGYKDVKAPFDGTITMINNMVGDTVSSATPTFRMDDLTSLYVDLQVAETDIAKIKVDQPAIFTFDAISNKTYNGKITSIGQIGAVVSGAVNFTITTQISDADASVKPGMTASGGIVVASFNNVLVIPSRALRTINNRQVVYVLSSTPITQITPSAGGSGTGGTGGVNTTPGTQRTRTTGSTGGTGGTGTTGGTGAAGGFGATGATGGTGNFGGFTRVALNPIPTTNGQSLIPIQVQVGIASDSSTQITSTQLKAGDLIVVNMPSNASTINLNSRGGNPFGGGGVVTGGGGGNFRGGGG